MRMALAVIATLLLGAGGALADPVEGVWQTQPDEGAYAHVRMEPCGAKFCGTMIRTFKSDGEYKSPNIGKKLVIDMVPTGGGKYEGQVWRPSNNKIYKGKLELSGNTLQMGGCVAGGLICAKQTWSRVQ